MVPANAHVASDPLGERAFGRQRHRFDDDHQRGRRRRLGLVGGTPDTTRRTESGCPCVPAPEQYVFFFFFCGGFTVLLPRAVLRVPLTALRSSRPPTAAWPRTATRVQFGRPRRDGSIAWGPAAGCCGRPYRGITCPVLPFPHVGEGVSMTRRDAPLVQLQPHGIRGPRQQRTARSTSRRPRRGRGAAMTSVPRAASRSPSPASRRQTVTPGSPRGSSGTSPPSGPAPRGPSLPRTGSGRY